MTAELLVNVTPSETRVAYIDGGIPVSYTHLTLPTKA